MNLAFCDLLGIGLSVFDNSLFIPHHPSADEKIVADHSIQSLGGPACIGTLTANRLGLKTVLISASADDYPGHYIQNKQKSYSNHTLISLKTDLTPQASILINKNGERSVIATLAKTVEKTIIKCTKPPKYILLDGRYVDVCFDMIMDLKKQGSQIILDAGSVNPGVMTILAHVDILIASKKFAFNYTNHHNIDQVMDQLQQSFPKVIVTLGEEGAKYYLEGKRGSLSANKVKVVNTNGAGDIFHGAFIAGLAAGLDLIECSKLAGRIATWHCTQESVEVSLKKLGSSLSLQSFL
jgi:sulfofructose kinase